jgi:hypothetical protein
MKALIVTTFFLGAVTALAQPTAFGGPAKASQAEVNAGTVDNKYVSPKTLNDWEGGGGTPVDPSQFAEAPTTGNLASNAITLGKAVADTGLVSWSTNQTFTFTGGNNAPGDAQVIRATVTVPITLTFTLTSSTAYHNGSLAALDTPYQIYLPAGRHRIFFSTPDTGTTLDIETTSFEVPGTIVMWVNNYGTAITTGVQSDLAKVRKAGRVNSWEMVATTSTGSITMDIAKDTYANLPPVFSPSSDSIVGAGTKPFITSGTKNNGAVTDWGTTTFSADDYFRLNVVSNSGITFVLVILNVTYYY